MKLFGYSEVKSRSKEASLSNKKGELIVSSCNGDGWNLDMVLGEALDMELLVEVVLVIGVLEKEVVMSAVPTPAANE